VSFERILDIQYPCRPAISPDGTRVAFAVETAYTVPDEGRPTQIWVAAVDGSGAQRVTDGPRTDNLPAWSPDNLTLAFLSDRDKPKVAAIHLLEPDGSTRRIGDLDGSVEAFRWSADGTAVMALVAESGDPKADPQVVSPGQYWRRLHTVDVASGQSRLASPAGINVWEFDWHGDEIAALVSNDPSENGWYDARVVRISGDEVTTAHEPRLQAASIALEPTTGAIAFADALASDRGVLYGRVTIASATGEVQTHAPGFDVGEVSWIAPGTLFCNGRAGIGAAVGTLTAEGIATVIWEGPADLENAVSDGRTVAAGHSAWTHPPELRTFQIDEPDDGWSAITRLNAGAADIKLPLRERFAWKAPDGEEIDGHLVTPLGHTGDALPLIVLVHGGPTAAYGSGYPTYFTSWQSEAGYALFMPNPRGSVGRGDEFTEANLGDMGGGDLADVLSGVDALIAQGIVDGDRLAIMGGSYGGFQTAWAITQTERFKAAIAIAAVTDWLSFHNTTNIARFDEQFMQADPYEAGGEYHRLSPVVHAARVTTPTLVMHGELDLCVPLAQGQELYAALAAEGVDTELIIYPREGHGWSERAHILDSAVRMRAWFDRYLGATSDQSQ
jgi:dipeptidyl aminopeptidase/acylaminoacyl peptidase